MVGQDAFLLGSMFLLGGVPETLEHQGLQMGLGSQCMSHSSLAATLGLAMKFCDCLGP